jgi:hypothetical protein
MATSRGSESSGRLAECYRLASRCALKTSLLAVGVNRTDRELLKFAKKGGKKQLLRITRNRIWISHFMIG